MKLSALIIISSVIALTSCAGGPPTKSYYNRRAFPPPSYYYGHKGGFNAGPPIHKYRPPGFRATRNPYIGPAPSQGGQHQPLVQGVPQSLHHNPPQSLQQSPPQPQLLHQGQQIFHQGQPQILNQGPPQILNQGQTEILTQGQPQLLHQGQQQVLHQGQQQALHQVQQQVLHQGQQQVPHQGQQQVLHQVQHQVPQQGPQSLLHQAQIQGAQQGHGQVVHYRVPQNTHQGLPQGARQGISHNIPQGVTPALHPGLPQGHHHHHHLPQNIQQGPHHSLTQASPYPGHSYQQVPQQSQVFQSLPPKRLTPAPTIFAKTQIVPQFTAAPYKYQPSHLNSIRDDFNEGVSFTPATKSYYKPNDERSPIHTIPAPKLSPADKPADFDARMLLAAQQQLSTTPRFKNLDKTVADQLKNNPAAILAQQIQTQFAPEQTQFAPDPDPQTVLARVPPSNDPFSEPSNGQLPIDIYLQKQLDNEIAQQESLYIQQQHAQQYQQQAEQYQQQLEVAQQLLQQQQAYQIQQENLKQQVLQHQALEAQKQLALQSQQNQQASESLTAEELFNLMNGISTTVQQSTESVQDVLSKPQNENEITSAATTNFQPDYQSFNYDEKAHQQRQVSQNELTNETVETKRSTGESDAQTNINPQYQTFNYDEKTKRNGFNNEDSNSVTKDIKKEKRYQKHAFSANNEYGNGYSTLPKEIADTIPQVQYDHQLGGYSTLPVNYNEKPNLRKLKPDNSATITEIKKHLRKKNRLPNNGYSTIAEDLLQQHDLKNDVQQLTYSTLPNTKIIEVLKQQIQLNSTHQVEDPTVITTEKNALQKMRETAQKFYNPHILQAVRNNTSNDNVQIQQSIQIYEKNYASKGDDNHIDLSGITTTSTAPAVSSTVSSATEPTVITEINVIENNSNDDSENQESHLYEEIMLQDESKPLEDNYNSNSHSYFGQRIRPKRT